MKEKEDVSRARETLQNYQQRLQDLEAEFKTETDLLASKTDPATEELQKISLRPAKKDILVRMVSLVLLPYWQTQDGKLIQAWQ